VPLAFASLDHAQDGAEFVLKIPRTALSASATKNGVHCVERETLVLRGNGKREQNATLESLQGFATKSNLLKVGVAQGFAHEHSPTIGNIDLTLGVVQRVVGVSGGVVNRHDALLRVGWLGWNASTLQHQN
jgi:hypothetical protein